jgi:hypothetical protein
MRSPAVYSLKFGLVLKRPDHRSSHGKRLMSLAGASTESAPDFGPTTLIASVGCSFNTERLALQTWLGIASKISFPFIFFVLNVALFHLYT